MLTFKEYTELTESLDSPYPMHHISNNYVQNSDGEMSSLVSGIQPPLIDQYIKILQEKKLST